MLLYNIVIDFLRSHKLNYSYSVFMSECNILSEDIVGKNKLSKIINMEEEVKNEEKFNISLI